MDGFSEFDRAMMRRAIEEARWAARAGEVPVGAALARGGTFLCAARNTRESARDPAGHAEINALRAGAALLGDWRLGGCTLYVTLEPCAMCAGAIGQARVARLVFGAYDAAAGCCGSVYRLTEDPAFAHFCIAEGGLLREECELLLRETPFSANSGRSSGTKGASERV